MNKKVNEKEVKAEDFEVEATENADDLKRKLKMLRGYITKAEQRIELHEKKLERIRKDYDEERKKIEKTIKGIYKRMQKVEA